MIDCWTNGLFKIMKREKKYWQRVYDVTTWLNIHITHLSYVRNTILALSVATLGFAIAQWQKITAASFCWIHCCLLGAIILLGVSIFLGLFIGLQQSKVYRLYRKISRIIEQSGEREDDVLDDNIFKAQRDECDEIEERNKYLFLFQVWVYFIGVAVLSFSLLVR